MKIMLRVKRLPATNEWKVSVTADGSHRGDLSYYTDDKQDAIDTQKHMAATYIKQGHEVTIVPM